MISAILIIVISLVLAIGHVWWGKQIPLKHLEELGNPIPVVASYHASWYHISIIFLVTAVVSGAQAFTSWSNAEVLWVLWIIIFGCWTTFLGVVYAYPMMRKLGWGQIALIIILLINLGLQASGTKTV